jgi:hypothetical protein
LPRQKALPSRDLRAGLIRDSERLSDLVERCPFGSAHLNAAKAEKAAFARRFRDLLADAKEPSLEGGRIGGLSCVENRRRLPQGDKRVLNEVSRSLHLGKALVQRLVELALPLPGLKLGDDRRDQFV